MSWRPQTQQDEDLLAKVLVKNYEDALKSRFTEAQARRGSTMTSSRATSESTQLSKSDKCDCPETRRDETR